MISIGSKSDPVKHVVSFRRFTYMILNSDITELERTLTFKIDGFEYVIFVLTDSMKCFGCGKTGHLVRTCPQAAGGKTGHRAEAVLWLRTGLSRNRLLKWMTLLTSGVITLGHLVDLAGPELNDADGAAACLRLRSTRTVAQLLQTWNSALSPEEKGMLMEYCGGIERPDEEDPFPELTLSPDLEGSTGSLTKKVSKEELIHPGALSSGTPLTVLGDFNLPSDKLHSSGLLALLNSFSLSFNSCPPTHKEGNVLDLVFTHPSPATDMTATPLHISDHHLVSFTITLPVLPKRNSQHLSLTRRNLHSISPSSVASCTLSSLPDHESFSSLPLDSATDTLLSSLSSTMDLLCPLSTIHRKNSSPAPWLSDVLRNNRRELRSAARKWKKSKLDTDLISYRMLLSKFSLDMTSAKTSFYKEKLETSAQDPRKLHNIFSSLLNPPAPPSPFSLTAEDFTTFYTEKIERICQTFTSLPTSPTSHSQHSATPSLTQLSTVASEEVLQITRSCNPTTCPLDPIPSAMLQTISPDLLPFVTTVINGSLTSGHVPTVFKKARVIPILKKPALDPSDISNYRPVSLLSFLSKILERVVCNQLSDYLMQNNLHDPNQSGFKAAHSTETALLAVTEKLHAARSAKLSSVLILLDLSIQILF
ncbi:hypothetical protein QTP86_009284 [Hemibagrus guttatus]|nr:hypothetical protein QTP86_009284 [Hemibagrus guttatus]